ncbi:YolD-like family protein [Psychrobacillus glaciei]|uniref:YolD-like family protein n=1 Tax=Psychrobacillus glaciei TaxID=2283160 RepID=A0A5J6SRV4_9BACI|nr:YolD-like family protein [Psychrobacillus glaciei]QFF98907.1 YolD-like family protein [Psychrobacillus glaciei]
MAYLDEMMDHQLDLLKVRDRGSKKWVAMMLPEHLKLVREYIDEQKKTPRPELNEWDLDIIQENIQIAMKRNVEVEIKTWKDGAFIFHIGKFIWVDLNRRKIEMEDVFKSFVLQLDDIVDVTVLD